MVGNAPDYPAVHYRLVRLVVLLIVFGVFDDEEYALTIACTSSPKCGHGWVGVEAERLRGGPLGGVFGVVVGAEALFAESIVVGILIVWVWVRYLA